MEMRFKKFLSLPLLCLAFGCGGSGTQGTAEAPADSASKASTAEFCERSENLDNVLCKWVATEFTVEYPSGGAKMGIVSDSAGRLAKMLGYMNPKDLKNPTSVVTRAYEGDNIRFQEGLSNPDPNDPSKFLDTTTTTYSYNSDGKIEKSTEEYKSKGVLSSTYTTEYFYGGNAKGFDVFSVETGKDSTGAVTSLMNHGFQKDKATGRTLVHETKRLDPGNSTVNNWTIDTFSYDPVTGRLKSYVSQDQDCLKAACVSSIVPQTIKTTRIFHDDAGRAIKILSEDDGDIKSNTPPNGVVDSTYACEFEYGNASAAPYAYLHPLMSFASLGVPTGFEDAFTVKDTFTVFKCPGTQPNSNMTMTFVQKRLWEALGVANPAGSGS